MKQVKITSSVILGVLIVVLVLQNTEAVETRILFFSVTMSRAALLTVALLIGYVLGVLTTILVGTGSRGDTDRHGPSKEREE